MKQKIRIISLQLIMILGIFFLTTACTKNQSEALQLGKVEVSSNTFSGPFAEVDKLIADKKYSTAFKLLSDMNDGKSEDVLVKQFRFVTEYFIQSTMHQMFLFKDLDPGESILELRKELPVGEYEYTLFDPVKIYNSFIEANGPSPNLDLALGEYYQDAISRYGDQWLISPDEVQQKVKALFISVDNAGISTGNTLSTLGEYAYYEGDFKASKEYYSRSLELEYDNANVHYNYAGTLFSLGETDEFFTHIQYAIDNYEDPRYRADAFFMAAQAAIQINDLKRAEKYLLGGYDAYPLEYRFAQNLNNLYIHLKQFTDAAKFADAIYSLDPKNPNASRMVMDNYNNNNQYDELVSFFLRNLEAYKDNENAMGNLSYHLALLYSEHGEKELALSALNVAEKNFKSVFSEDNAVFGVIDQLRSKL
jgi:tetratricopeptide (TPR) repeat protein